MFSLPHYPLPLPTPPPPDFVLPVDVWSERSGTTDFKTGIDERDTFDGDKFQCDRRRCIVCGARDALLVQRCHIIEEVEYQIWTSLKEKGYVPPQAKSVQHEPRNGVSMCANHHVMFDSYRFFIRYIPSDKKYVFINVSGAPWLRSYHGKAVALSPDDRHAVFPTAFLIHEVRARAFHPFVDARFDIPAPIQFQDWILKEGYVAADGTLMHKHKSSRPAQIDPTATPMHPVAGLGPAGDSPATQTDSQERSGEQPSQLAYIDQADVAKILAATHQMFSWRACMMEGTDWSGTTEQNVQKYNELFGEGSRDA